MHSGMRFAFGVVVVVSCSTVLGGQSFAQPTLPPAVSLTATQASEMKMKDMDVALSSPLTGSPMLAGFDFRFASGDHKIRRLSVLAKDRFASLAMSDQNGDDEYGARAAWANCNVGRVGSVTATGGGQFAIALPEARPADHKLVLRGFEFRRKDGTDANIRAIGVWLDESRNAVRVTLMDDQGPDFRGFEASVGVPSIADTSLAGQRNGVAATMSEAMQRVNAGEKSGKYRTYAVTVQYTWIHSGLLYGLDVVTGTRDVPSSSKRVKGGSNVVLQGFEFFFTNSEHHLGQWAIFGPMLKDAPKLTTPPESFINFRDQNTDDPKRWAVAYGEVRSRC